MRFAIVCLVSLTGSLALAQVSPNDSRNHGTVPPSGTAPSAQPSTTPGAPHDITGPSAVPGTTASQDGKFVRDAAQANLAEIKLGELAVRNGSTAQVRKMGQMMIDDHRKLGDKLQSIATREGLTLPTELTADQRAIYDRLSALTGSDFDSAYMDQLKSDHQQAISLFQDEAQNGSDAQLKSFAQSALPSLRHHQQMANRPVKKM